jgi:hypothetical protein
VNLKNNFSEKCEENKENLNRVSIFTEKQRAFDVQIEKIWKVIEKDQAYTKNLHLITTHKIV